MLLMMHQPHLHQPWRLDRCNPFIYSLQLSKHVKVIPEGADQQGRPPATWMIKLRKYRARTTKNTAAYIFRTTCRSAQEQSAQKGYVESVHIRMLIILLTKQGLHWYLCSPRSTQAATALLDCDSACMHRALSTCISRGPGHTHKLALSDMEHGVVCLTPTKVNLAEASSLALTLSGLVIVNPLL